MKELGKGDFGLEVHPVDDAPYIAWYETKDKQDAAMRRMNKSGKYIKVERLWK